MIKSKKTSIYYGVSKYGENSYSSRTVINNKRIYIGSFDNELSAALAYDEYIKTYLLNKRLNFPDPEPENLIPNTRLIRLTKGKFAVVDEEDFEYINQWNWCTFVKNGFLYAKRKEKVNGIKVDILMHRAIINANSEEVDHINSNGLHNYRSNLRECTHQENMMNRRPNSGCKSTYKGVTPSDNQFKSRIRVNKKLINLGYFFDEIEAAKAYDTAAIKYFGEFANINFKTKQNGTLEKTF